MAKTTTKGEAALSIEAAPHPVDAGTDLTIVARVVCDPPCDLTGDALAIRSVDGSDLAILTFSDFEDETGTSSGSVTLEVPVVVGEYAFSAVLEAFTADDLSFDSVTTPVAVTVQAHATSVNIWDAPTATGLGERLPIKVGVKCTCGCSLAGLPFTVHDETGTKLATGTLGSDVWPSTDALYFAEVELEAPTDAALGNHTWSIRFPATGVEAPHSSSMAQFGVIFVPAPEHLVTVEALDIAQQTPLAGATILMHPYRAVTNDSGIARLRVPKGDYTLFVSARRYVSDSASVAVTGDLTTQARLAVEVRRERV